jgi:hypothetical protein
MPSETKWTPGPWRWVGSDSPDAHLIAAAPDLYEALEEVLEEFEPLANFGPWKHQQDKCQKARSALAKARGESIPVQSPRGQAALAKARGESNAK